MPKRSLSGNRFGQSRELFLGLVGLVAHTRSLLQHFYIVIFTKVNSELHDLFDGGEVIHHSPFTFWTFAPSCLSRVRYGAESKARPPIGGT